VERLKGYRELRQDLFLAIVKIGTASLLFAVIVVTAMILLESAPETHSTGESIGNWPVYQDELKEV
jgi:hypothetical protein